MPGVLKNLSYHDPYTRYKGQRLIDVVKKLGYRAEIPLELAIDVLYSLYLPFPRLIDVHEVPLGSEKHYQLISTLLLLPETKKLRLYTVADSFLSTTLGALVLMNLLDEFGNEISSERTIKGAGGRDNNLGASRAPQTSDRELGEDEGFREKVRRAVENALRDAETIRKVKNLAYGYRAGVGHVLNLENDVVSVLKLVKNTDVKKLLEWLERMPSLSTIVKRKKYRFSKGFIEGYTTGSDLDRLVPTELAYPEIYFYARLADNKLLLYDKYLQASLGPLYVLVDKSGSMEGEKILWAKATAIALFLRSRIERRPFFIRFFDSEPFSLMRLRSSAKPSEALRFLEYLAMVRGGGGTDISKAIITACNDIAKYRSRGLSEIILITDGEDRIAKSLVRRSLAQASAKLISVMIMGDNADLKQISDKYFRVIKLDEKEMLKVVEA